MRNLKYRRIKRLLFTLLILSSLLWFPSVRIFLCGATVAHLKSGEWVVSGPGIRMSDSRFPWLVQATNGHGGISCMRISHPKMTALGFRHLEKLKNLKWLYIENSDIKDDSLKHLESLSRLKKLRFSQCPNLTVARIDQLKKTLSNCSISFDADKNE